MDNQEFNQANKPDNQPRPMPINEDMHLEKEWFQEAKKVTESSLPDFVHSMLFGYKHDYGTMCHAVAACAVAAASAGNHEMGLSNFQAAFVMWDFIRHWIMDGNKCGMRLIDYDNMLYPQYEDKFQKVIDRRTWEAIQKEARVKLSQSDSAAFPVRNHWRQIADGYAPFGYSVVERI